MSNNQTYSKSLFGLCLFGLLAAIGLVLATYLYTRMGEVNDTLFKFAGRLHPVTLHLPIGTVSVLFLLEVFSLFMRKRCFVPSKMVVLAFTVATLAVAACTGLLLAKTGGYEGELLDDHRLQGLILAGVITAAAFFRLIYYSSQKAAAMFVYVVLLICGMGVMALAGHSGGGLTHGTSFLTEYQPEWLGGDPEAHEGHATVAFADSEGVLRIFGEKCVSCHGVDKQKGDYRMDTREAAFTAGDSELVPIVEGDAMGSYLVRLITYDPGHDDVMAPEGKTQLTHEEILQIIHWVDAGAPWDADASVEAVKKPDEAKPATPSTDPEKPAIAKPEAPATTEGARPAAAPAPAKIKYVEMKALEAQDGGILVTELEPGKLSISLSAEHRKDPASFDLVKALEPHKGMVHRLNVTGAELSADSWKGLAGLEGLEQLYAAYTNIDNPALEALSGLASLTHLNLVGTDVSMGGLEKLVANANLRRLWVSDVEAMNVDTIEKLRATLPNCDVIAK